MGIFSKKQPTTPPRRRLADTEVERSDRATFVRNRTLTGSSSSQVRGVSDHIAQLQSPRTQAHHLARHRQRIGLLFIVVLAICGLLGMLILEFTAQVTVRTSEVSMKLDDTYTHEIQSYLDRQPIERLRFLLNTKQLLAYLQSVAPEVSDLQIDGSAGYGTTGFVLTLRQPTLAWTIGSHRQYVDANGVAFDRNYFAEPSVQVVDQSGIQVADGQTIASNRFLGFMGRVVGVEAKAGRKVTQVILPRDVTREVDIQIDGVGYPVRLSVDRPVGEQLEDADRAITWLAAHNQTPKYLDVRVSRRAYYQ